MSRSEFFFCVTLIVNTQVLLQIEAYSSDGTVSMVVEYRARIQVALPAAVFPPMVPPIFGYVLVCREYLNQPQIRF